MAHIETWYRCPVCNCAYDDPKEAMRCRDQHQIKVEYWAVGKGGKAVMIFDNWSPNSEHGIRGALREADLSDDIHERKRQLEVEENRKCLVKILGGKDDSHV